MLIATFTMAALLAAAPGAKQADTQQNHQAEATCTHSAKAVKWVETRRDNPHSTVVESPNALEYVATDAQFNAAQTGNPYSTDFRYSNQGGSGSGNLDALEAENPHSAQPGRRVAVASRVAATKCGCMVSDARAASGPGAGGQH